MGRILITLVLLAMVLFIVGCETEVPVQTAQVQTSGSYWQKTYVVYTEPLISSQMLPVNQPLQKDVIAYCGEPDYGYGYNCGCGYNSDNGDNCGYGYHYYTDRYLEAASDGFVSNHEYRHDYSSDDYYDNHNNADHRSG